MTIAFLARIILLSVATSTTSIYASSGAHGGADNRTQPDYYSWFVGDAQRKVVSYCVSFARSHRGFKLTRLQQSVDDAFKQWQVYVQRAPSKTDQLNLEPKYLGDCWQMKETDLKILVGFDVGGHNELFAPAWNRLSIFQNPSSFSRLDDHTYDFKRGWGKGFIWLHSGHPYPYQLSSGEVKDLSWEEEGALEMLILHEVGHILGVGHIPGTIMDEDVIHRLYLAQHHKSTSKQWLTEIDDTQELLPRPPSKSQTGADVPELRVLIAKAFFNLGFNQQREKTVAAKVSWPDGIENPYTITVDHIGKEFPIKVRPFKVTKTIVTSPPVFNVCLDPAVSGAKSRCNGIERKSFIQMAELLWPVGIKSQVMISHNIPSRSEGGGYSVPDESQHIFSIDQVFNEEAHLKMIRSMTASELQE